MIATHTARVGPVRLDNRCFHMLDELVELVASDVRRHSDALGRVLVPGLHYISVKAAAIGQRLGEKGDQAAQVKQKLWVDFDVGASGQLR